MLYKKFLKGEKIYACSNCHCHLAYHEDIISKSFQGRHGRAYLFETIVNFFLGEPEDRTLITGVHTVCDVFCVSCQTVLGWKYEDAKEESQKYKVGKFIVEKVYLVKEADWE